MELNPIIFKNGDTYQYAMLLKVDERSPGGFDKSYFRKKTNLGWKMLFRQDLTLKFSEAGMPA